MFFIIIPACFETFKLFTLTLRLAGSTERNKEMPPRRAVSAPKSASEANLQARPVKRARKAHTVDSAPQDEEDAAINEVMSDSPPREPQVGRGCTGVLP